MPPQTRIDIQRVSENIVVEFVDQSTRIKFWQNYQAQADLRNDIIQLIDAEDIYPFEDEDAIADSVMDLGRANRSLIAAQKAKP